MRDSLKKIGKWVEKFKCAIGISSSKEGISVNIWTENLKRKWVDHT